MDYLEARRWVQSVTTEFNEYIGRLAQDPKATEKKEALGIALELLTDRIEYERLIKSKAGDSEDPWAPVLYVLDNSDESREFLMRAKTIRGFIELSQKVKAQRDEANNELAAVKEQRDEANNELAAVKEQSEVQAASIRRLQDELTEALHCAGGGSYVRLAAENKRLRYDNKRLMEEKLSEVCGGYVTYAKEYARLSREAICEECRSAYENKK